MCLFGWNSDMMRCVFFWIGLQIPPVSSIGQVLNWLLQRLRNLRPRLFGMHWTMPSRGGMWWYPCRTTLFRKLRTLKHHWGPDKVRNKTVISCERVSFTFLYNIVEYIWMFPFSTGFGMPGHVHTCPGAAFEDKLGEHMRAWAQRMAQNATYLEFPDVFLLAHLKKLNFKFFVYCEGTWNSSLPQLHCASWNIGYK